MANKVTISLEDLNLALSANSSYSIVFEEGFVNGEDAGSPTVGAGNFVFTTTSNGPVLESTTPQNNSTGYISNNIVYEFDSYLKLGSGNFYLYKEDGDELIETISSSDSRIFLDGTTLFIDVSSLIDSFETYYITCDNNLIKDVFGIGTTLTENSLKWTTGGVSPALFVSSGTMVLGNGNWVNYNTWTTDRTYYGGRSNLIFSSNTPSISESNDFVFTVKANNGVLKHPSTQEVSSEISISGSTTQINPLISSIEYYPNKDYTGTESITIGLYAGDNYDTNSGVSGTQPGNLLEKYILEASYLGFDGETEEIVTLTSSQTYSIPFPYNFFYSKFDLLVVGGGASGNYRAISSSPRTGAGSGGGGGGAIVVKDLNVSSFTSAYSIVVGQGGEPYQAYPSQNWIGNDGGNSSAFGYTATGGTAPIILGSPPAYGAYTEGGESGVPNKNSSSTRNGGGLAGYDGNASIFRGGGGGGSGDPGQDAVGPGGFATFGYSGKGGDANVDSYFAVFGASGTQGRYGGGGGGAYGGAGGDGGGGNGGNSTTPPENGEPNTGGGGGGGSPAGVYTGPYPELFSIYGFPGSGADGVVKLRFHN